MSRQELVQQIEQNRYARVSFKDCVRPAMYGFFVKLYDYEHLISKGMIRFVSEPNELAYSLKQVTANTRIFDVTTFKDIDYREIFFSVLK